MEDRLMNIGSIMGKDILDLSDGAYVGKVQGIVVGSDGKVAGIRIRQKGLLGNKNVVPFDHVKAFGNAVTIHGVDGVVIAEGKDVLGKNVITADGTVLGRIWELAFDPVSGKVEEVVLKSSLIKDQLGGKGILPGDKIMNFGKDVVITVEGVTLEDFQPPEEDLYGDWKAVDEVLDELDELEECAFDTEAFEEKKENGRENHYEQVFDEMTNSIGKTIESAFGRIKDELTSEKFKEQTEGFIDKFSEEAKGFFNDMRDKLQNLDTEGLKEDLKNRVGKKDSQEDELAAGIVTQLQGKTVAKPLLDSEGNVIVWPGQIIGKEEVKGAIRGGKLQELLDLATVALVKDTVPESTESQAETDTEIIVDAEMVEEKPLSEEEAVFIKEEVEQMQQAEQSEPSEEK